VTAKDNGGKAVGVTLTFSKAISDITNNADVLKACGALAKALAVPYSRVTDQYGGFFGQPSPYLPTSVPKAATPAATNTTKAATNATKTRLLNATANATAKQTAWTV